MVPVLASVYNMTWRVTKCNETEKLARSERRMKLLEQKRTKKMSIIEVGDVTTCYIFSCLISCSRFDGFLSITVEDVNDAFVRAENVLDVVVTEYSSNVQMDKGLSFWEWEKLEIMEKPITGKERTIGFRLRACSWWKQWHSKHCKQKSYTIFTVKWVQDWIECNIVSDDEWGTNQERSEFDLHQTNKKTQENTEYKTVLDPL